MDIEEEMAGHPDVQASSFIRIGKEREKRGAEQVKQVEGDQSRNETTPLFCK
jgi:hypothetical protein